MNCPHCGAVIADQPLERLDDIKGLEHAKRATEVAVAGGHPIAFMGEPNSVDAERLAKIAIQWGVWATATQPCPCGKLGSTFHTCYCTPEAVQQYRDTAHRAANETAHIFIDIPEVPEYKILSNRKPEADEHVLHRIAEAQGREQVDPELTDEASKRLAEAAVRQLALSQTQYRHVLLVAATIARLAGDSKIRPVHLAEAIQYRPRRRG